MNVLIHDLKPSAAGRLFPTWTEERGWLLFPDDGSIHPCIGCFGCWVRTPGACVIRDRYGDLGKCLGRCDSLVLVTRCTYGGFSPFVKQVVDRSISYLHPDFVLRNGEMHHRRRYENRIALWVLFYGQAIPEAEQETARAYAAAVSLNLDCDLKKVEFRSTAEAWEGETL